MGSPNFSALGAIAATPPPAGGFNFSNLGAISAPATPAAAPDPDTNVQPTAATSAPVSQPATMPPASAWQRLKNAASDAWDGNATTSDAPEWAKPYVEFAQKANPGQQIPGLVKGGLGSIGGLLSIGQKIAGQLGSVHDMDAFKTEHPGATDEQARAAVYPTDPNQQAYVSPETAKSAQDLATTTQWFKDHAESQGFWQGIGNAGEGIAELLGGEGLTKLAGSEAAATEAGAKAISTMQKMKEAAGVGEFLTKHEKIAKLVAVGMRTVHAAAEAGAQSAGQTYVKSGGDATQAAEAGGLGAVLGGGVTAVTEGVPTVTRMALQKLARPSTTVDAVSDAAKEAVAARAEATNLTRTAQPAAGAAEPYTFRIRGEAPVEGVSDNLLQEPARQHVGHDVMEGKGPTERLIYPEPQRGVTTEQVVRPNGDEPGTVGSHRAPTFELSTDSKPGQEVRRDRVSSAGGGDILTQDAATVQNHVAALGEAINSPEFETMPPHQQQSLLTQRDDMQEQLSGYYQHQKATGVYPANFKPIDTADVVSRTNTFEDAADHLHANAKEVYDHANTVSNGNWQTLKNHLEDLHDKLGKIPSDVPSLAGERAGVRGQIDESQHAMDRILDDPRNGIDQVDADAARRNFRAEYVLRDAHAAIKPLYDIEQHVPLVSGQYRGFNGNMLGSRWASFLKENPDAKDIIGADRVQTLQQLFQKNESMASRKRFGTAMLSVAGGLVGLHFGGLSGGAEGALAGGGSYRANRYALDHVITSPRIAKNLLFAMDSGASPSHYGPSIAKMIADQAKRTLPPAAATAIVRGAQ